MTDVSLPMNVSDVDDPPTVIHRPPAQNTSTHSKGGQNAPPVKYNQPQKITLDMGSNLLHGSQKPSNPQPIRPELKSTVFGVPRTSNETNSFGLPEQITNDNRTISHKTNNQNQDFPSQNNKPQKSHQVSFNMQSSGSQQQPTRGRGTKPRGGQSPNQLSQSLSPDNSLSVSSNTRTAVYSGKVKEAPVKRAAASQSPAAARTMPPEIKVKLMVLLKIKIQENT